MPGPTKSAFRERVYEPIVQEQVDALHQLQEQYDRETDPAKKQALDKLVSEAWFRLYGPGGKLARGGRRRTRRTRRVKRKGTKAKKSRKSRR